MVMSRWSESLVRCTHIPTGVSAQAEYNPRRRVMPRMAMAAAERFVRARLSQWGQPSAADVGVIRTVTLHGRGVGIRDHRTDKRRTDVRDYLDGKIAQD